MKILLTAYEPFNNMDTNSAMMVMELMDTASIQHDVIMEQLPVVYDQAAQQLLDAIKTHQPDAVICLGQAGGTTGLRIERMAVNMDDCSLADNAGVVRQDHPIAPEGADGYFSTLPTRAMLEACVQHNIPAEISYTAGNYLCNHIMYCLLHALKDTHVRGGFIHIPLAPQQAAQLKNRPSMDSQWAAKGLEIMLNVIE